jgi:hypothetical protein
MSTTADVFANTHWSVVLAARDPARSATALEAVAPTKGRFRAFLLAALKHFLANEWDKARAQKRGGGVVPASWDAETRYQREPLDELTTERLFDRQWRLCAGISRRAARARPRGCGRCSGRG